jgi:hypothetical protein
MALINVLLRPKYETYEKCSILFKFKPPARGAYAPEGKTNPPPNFGGLTTGIY